MPRLKLIWADGGYTGPLIEWVKETCGEALKTIKPIKTGGFQRIMNALRIPLRL
jgi:hypothetical protein